MEHFTIKNLDFSYPGAEKKTLENINFTVKRGQYITICGKSGSGKTTLMRHLKSVLTPHGKRTGTILFEGVPLDAVSLRTQSAQIGYVMQNPDNQIVTDKVWHELAFGLESLGCDARTMRLRVAEMASYFGIETWFHKNVSELSGGQKQLLNLASIMAMQPTALLLDEPTSQLDPIAAADFLNTVRKINLELGTTILISEHRLEEVFPCADRVIVMEDGQILADDTPRKIGEILKNQAHDMFASLPAPMQIFYGVESRLACPLTVREGRNWLSESFENVPIKTTQLPEEAAESQVKDAALTVKEIWFRYEKNQPDILKGVSLTVAHGETFAVLGGNGTGKSTLLKAICGICKPYRGKILCSGKPIDKRRKNQFDGGIAMLPQDPQSLFVKKTVREDLAEMLGSGTETQAEKNDLLCCIAAECEITHLLNAHPYDLSGGEQQRAALAKVLLCKPEILLLDEPTKGLDNFFKKKLSEILIRLKKRGTTVILVSHDVEFCARYADRVAMFFDGTILTTNTPRRFFSQNSFYTTAANRMSRHLFSNAITDEEVIQLCKINIQNS
ncbi:MAG: energy-coupling factor transporter ATPase [Ruthenibacterium sp.]